MKLKVKASGGSMEGGQQINWDHALASYIAQNLASGLVSRLSPNSQQNTIQEFNRQQFSPMNFLPSTPNVSQQAQFGYRRGGAIGGLGYWPPRKMESGGSYDMGEAMRRWIMDDEEATPTTSNPEPDVPQQQIDPGMYDALQFAQFAQLMGLDQADATGDQPADEYMYEQGGPVTDGELYHVLGDEVDDERLDILKKGGWIQKANASIKRRGTKGVCTGSKFGGPTCRPGTRRYALAKTFRKMAKHRKKHEEGGIVEFQEGGEYDLQPEQIIGLIGQGYNIEV